VKDEHVLDDLSAYLDGENADPARLARHLGACARCARRFEEIKTLSTRLRELPGPEVGPEFAVRVLDAVERAPLSQRPGERMRFGISLAAAVAAMALLVIAGWSVYRSMAPPLTTRGYLAALAVGNQTALLETLGQVLDGNQGGAVWEAVEPFSGWSAADEPTGDEWLEVLANDEWFAAMAETLDEDADVDALLATLEENEVWTLKELLEENAAT